MSSSSRPSRGGTGSSGRSSSSSHHHSTSSSSHSHHHSSSSSSSHHNHVVAAMPTSTRGVSLSLPLLEGLCQRPESARRIVNDALKTLEAAQRISKFVSQHHRRRQQQQQPSNNTTTTTTTNTTKVPKKTTTTTPAASRSLKLIPYQQRLPPHQHWLWDAMKSSSRAERHVAARILLAAVDQQQQRQQEGDGGGDAGSTRASTSSNNESFEMAQWKLQHVLMALWNQHILSSSSTPPPPPTVSSGDHRAIVSAASQQKQHHQLLQQLPANIPMEWMALLKHVVLGGKMVTEERIMAFCLGGIPWITQSIWQLVTALNNSSDNNSGGIRDAAHTKSNTAAFAPTQIQALIGLVELCYSVLLVVFIEPEQPTTTTTPQPPPTTPPPAAVATTTSATSTTIGGSSGPGPNSSGTSTTTTATTNNNATAGASTSQSALAGGAGTSRSSSTRRLGSAAGGGGGGVLGGSLRALAALGGTSNSATTSTTTGSAAATTTTTTTTAAAGTVADSTNKDTSATAVAKRLTLRRRVLKRLFWKSMDNNNNNNSSSSAAAAHPHHHHLATTNNTDVSSLLSPLACLIGAFHIWKTNTAWPYPGPTADACLTMLKQLVDPTSTAKAVSLAGLTTTTPTPPSTSTTTTTTTAGGGVPPPPPPPPPPPGGTATSGSSSSRTTARDGGVSSSTVNSSIRREQRRRKRQLSRSPGLSATSASSTTRQQQQQQQATTGSAGTFLFRTTETNRRNNTSATATSSAVAAAGSGVRSSSSRPSAAEVEAAATDGTVTRLLSSVLSAHTASASAAVRHSQSDPEDDDDDDDDEEEEEEEEEVMDVEEEESEDEVVIDDHHHHHHHHEEDEEEEEEENDNNDDNDVVHDDIAPEQDEEIDSDEAENHHEDEDENEAEEEEENENHEDDEEEEEEDDDEEDDDEEELGQEDEGLVLHDDDVARFEGLLELNDAAGPMEIDLEDMEEAGANGLVMAATSAARSRLRGAGATAASSSGAATSSSGGSTPKSAVDSRELSERKRMYLQACMQVLAVQHPPVMSTSAAMSLVSRGGSLASSRAASRGASRCTSPVSHLRSSHRGGGFMSPGAISSSSGQSATPPKCFSLAAEQSLLESAMGIVRPTKKPVNTKMIMRRAPTQEEFFRGSLSRNPISLSMLKPSGGGNSGSGPSSSGDVYEPTVRDLRQHIADDLQMSDSAELLELLVANKILDVNLKLRVVHQVLWKNHLMENSHSGPAASSSSLASLLAGSGAGAPSFFSTGSGLSMMFSSGLGGISVGGSRGGVLSRSAGGQAITADTPLAALPPLVVTYRLAGVDGEATEDTVSTLVDPEAPSDAMSPEEVEQLMEKEYGITRIVTEGRGVYVLLRSVEFHIQDVLRRIRRDDVSVLMEYGTNRKSSAIGKNKSRNKFKQAPPYPGLALLRCCAKLPSNRKKLLQARAPTILLRLLLDVLNALEDPQAKSSLGLETAEAGDSGSNETGEILQELIEALASDISTTAVDAVSKPKETRANDESMTDETTSTSESVAAAAEGQDHDATTLSLVLSSLETISLSPPLRNIIAKLLPFLTYGQVDLSRELALNFARHIDVNALVDDDKDEVPDGVTNMDVSNEQSKENEGAVESPNRKETSKSSVLMEAFVQASMTLPSVEVCNSLRSELINCGFIHRLASFIMKDVPPSPPPWSAALLPKEDMASKASPSMKRQNVINSWREFFQRQGIKMAFNMLIGLCKGHPQTQAYISQIGEEGDKLSTSSVSFLRACHWMEATSDNASNRVYVRGVGLLAETLMDELMEENDFVSGKVKALRRATRERKKEIAQARRNKALLSMGSFGSRAGTGASRKRPEAPAEDAGARTQSATGVRNAAASLLAPIVGLFQNSGASEAAGNSIAASSSTAARSSPRATSRKRKGDENKAQEPPTKKPAWMMEMENLEDEEGLVCSVCQEGRTLQPSELLGLYAYVKKVSLPVEQCGSRENIDGATLLRTLPSSVPKSMVGTHAADQWYVAGKAAGDDLRDSVRSSFSLSSSVSSSRRSTYYTTTVSAGNAIHFSCHQRARQADRNHPKAPKSEWEGAALRNNRVNCNVILPLVSSRSSDVPLVAVDSALTEYQTAVNNLTGSSSKFSMLWTVLHDVRFLLLRMAHGESLSADCGGGSLSSNAQLLMHQLLMGDMFLIDAQVDTPETAQHVRNLSAGFLAACSIVHAPDHNKGSSSTVLTRAIADAAPMAALTCILTRNNKDDYSSGTDSSDSKPHPKRRWVVGRKQFLRGLVICAGRRHALGIETSGCISGRGGSTSSSGPRSSFRDWDSPETEDTNAASAGSASANSARKGKKRSTKPDIDDFGTSLRPMITLYAILDELSEAFVLNMKDPEVEETAGKIVNVLEQCHKAKDIRELLETCKATFLDQDEILDDFQRGMMAA